MQLCMILKIYNIIYNDVVNFLFYNGSICLDQRAYGGKL